MGTAAARRALWLPPILAGVVRLLLIVTGPAPEVWEYDEIARRWLAGDGYSCTHLGTTYRAYYSGVPYVATTAAVYAFSPRHPARMLLVQTVFAAATAALVAWLAAVLGGGRVGLLAGTLTALHPALAYYDTRKLHPLGLDTLLTVALVLALVLFERPRPRSAAGIGLLQGLALLQRSSLVPLVPIAAWWIATRPGTRGERGRAVAAFGASLLLCILPWVARNASLYGRPLLVTTSGEHFFVGNVPPSLGSNLLPSGQPVLEAADPRLLNDLERADEVEQDRLFWERGRAFVRDAPAAFAWGVARKLAYFWTLAPQTGALYPRRYRDLYLLFYAAVAAAAARGALRLGHGDPVQRRALFFILALFFSVSLVHAVFYVEMRHRWGIEPLLLVLAATGVAGRAGLSSSQRWRRRAPP